MARSAPDVPIIHTDPAKLQQVLYNFLSNAIKFSPAGGRIDLAAPGRRRPDGVRIVASPTAARASTRTSSAVIFEKFRQIDASVTRPHGGTGLGLAISKETDRPPGRPDRRGEHRRDEGRPPSGSRCRIKIEAGTQDLRAKLVLLSHL